ncbi:NAD(P)H-dependent oxidoreductase [Caulobacter sp. 1776]|uniref:FMN-dependent NADH-azoreductase n=1 Tax=Caulobacter sp. 1776 TaxID=3156420 RepID=UPI003393BAF6
MSHRLLYVEASPRGPLSVSTSLADHFVDRFRRIEPDLVVDRLALWDAPLPELGGALLSAKYAVLSKRDLDAAEARAWADIAQLIDRVRIADGLILATPMWNFGVPYKLKHWIDLITQPGLSFSFDPANGYRPLLIPRPTTVVLASAGDYASGPSWGRPNLAAPYLREALGFIGLKDPAIVLSGPTVGDAAVQAAARAAARDQLDGLVARHRRQS